MQVSGDGPAPEEAAVVGCLEIWIQVADHKKLSPPVISTFVIHKVRRVPDRTSTQVRKNGPTTEENEVVHGGEAQILSCIELQAIFDSEIALSFMQTEELVRA